MDGADEMSPEAWVAIAALGATLLAAAYFVGGKFAMKDDVEAATKQVEGNRKETERQFDAQNDKIDQGFKDVNSTLNRIDVTTTKTDGQVQAHDARITRVENDVDTLEKHHKPSRRKTRT
jgi:septal ring factor EnvC (AmiA/AmiB activator)